ncbi:MAG: DUF3291 domain-containing protein [Acidimicrobiia bacterium]|nr:DUF3291 domain-containing protein [Acidimicrobiia bacterium]
MSYHIAQLNIGRMAGPVDAPVMEGFVARLDEINALADSAPGFVWRLQTEDGDATSIRAFDDPLLLVNLSVWDSIESLHEFTYRSDHRELLRARKQWFQRSTGPYMVMWWVPAGHTPTLDEAKNRLDTLVKHGPTSEAFTFAQRFDQPTQDE